MTERLRSRQRIGKYRIESRLAEGGFAAVYRAFDTIECVPVALKVPYASVGDGSTLSDFKREARVTNRLCHANILPIKNADLIDGRFVIAYPLGEGTLSDWMSQRRSTKTILRYARQLIEAVAHAHQQRVVHCDLKPDNVILFAGDLLRLTDFGVARIASRVPAVTGSGTLGYLAPEHALGRPSFRSDVFSLGLILYEMLSGYLPEWPFRWPLERLERVRRRVRPEFVSVLQRCLKLDQFQRFEDATELLAAFRQLEERDRILARPALLAGPQPTTRSRQTISKRVSDAAARAARR